MRFKIPVKRGCIAVALFALFTVASRAQVAIKNNVLYDIATTPNLGVEVGLSKKTTAQLFYGLNPWKFSDTKQMRHWTLIPEYRYWLCHKFSGHFFGIHAMGGEFNVQGIDDPAGLLPFDDLKNNRYEGWYVGGGLTYGYQWILGKHWNLEASLGVGYDYVQYKKSDCGTCGKLTEKDHTHYVGPTKLALSIMYLF
jgi:hypothetical protein